MFSETLNALYKILSERSKHKQINLELKEHLCSGLDSWQTHGDKYR